MAGLHPDAAAIARQLATDHPAVLRKAVGPLDPAQMALVEAALSQYRLQSSTDTADLEAALTAIYTEAWHAGATSALHALPDGSSMPAGTPSSTATSTEIGPTSVDVADLDWNAWQPGWADAADQAATTPGLRALLDQAGVTIQGISDTQLDRIARAIAEALEEGDSPDTVAGKVDEVVGDSARSWLIAITETARAANAATLATYQANGIGFWNWLTASGCCDDCADNEEEGPYPVDGGPNLPDHPACRCSASPVFYVPASAVGSDGSVDDGQADEYEE